MRPRASSTVSHAASPIVNDGKMMWNETVNANCSRDSSKDVTSIAASLALQVRFRQIDEFVASNAHDSLHHVERDAFGHLLERPLSTAEFLINWPLDAATVMAQSAKSLAKSATTYAWEPPGEAHSIITTECRSAHERRVLGDRHRGRARGGAARCA